MIKHYGGRKLGRTAPHRRAMLGNLASSLLMHEKVVTTVAKAKEARRVAEKLIRQARAGEKGAARRVLRDRRVFAKLFDVLAARYQQVPGGFTQILRLGRRPSDGAELALIRLKI